MEVKQCDFCRMPFQSSGGKICRDCLIKLDEDFIKIRDYLYEHDNAGIEEVSEATGVSKKSIMHLLKEERLLVGDEHGYNGGILKCESCKRPINTGRMCAACKKEVLSALQESVSASPVRRPKQNIEKDEQDPARGVAKLQVKGRKRL
jgi:hypothetical protein